MKLISSAFEDGKRIPKDFTCEGRNLSPALAWDGVPDETKSFALVCADPDAPAGTWYHWAIFNIPADARMLPEAVPETPYVGNASQGMNDFKKFGYGGPCPPKGHGDHRYFFTLYALAVEALDLGPRAGCREVEKAAAAPALAKATLMGSYSRS